MKAVVAAFNREKALVGAFSVIVQLHRLIVYSTRAEPLLYCDEETIQVTEEGTLGDNDDQAGGCSVLIEPAYTTAMLHA